MSEKEVMIATWVLIILCILPLIAALAEHREYVRYFEERDKKR